MSLIQMWGAMWAWPRRERAVVGVMLVITQKDKAA